jgi:hypothetical protein
MLIAGTMKSAMVAVVVLALLLFYGTGNANCATLRPTSSRSSTDDMLSLLDFRNEISSDPGDFLRSWNTNSSAADYCGWNGVTCSRTHPGRVTCKAESLHLLVT